MRNALLTAALALSALAVTAAREETPAPPSVSLFPGTDAPAITECADGAAYAYKKYTIYVRQHPDFPGHAIDIYRHPSRPSGPCGGTTGRKHFSIPAGGTDGADFFAGVSGSYLFIEQGTGPSYRTVSVFDMREKTFPLLAVRYSDAKIEDGLFTYYEPRDEVEGALAKIPCPKASEWKRQGLGVGYEEKMSFDLKTGRGSSLRQFRCSPAQ